MSVPNPNPAAVTPPVTPPASPQVATDWRSGLTGEYAPLATDKTLESVKGKDWTEAGPILAKNYVETKKLVGNAVKIPAVDAKPEEVRAFWDKLGVPKDVTGYADVKLENIEDMPPIDTTVMDGMVKPTFLKLGLTPGQSQGALNLFREYTVQQRRASADAMIQGQEGLRTEWAMNFDRNVKIAQTAFGTFMSKPLQEAIRAAQLDMHPDFIKGWYDIGKQLVEDGLITGDSVTTPNTDELDAKIKATREEIVKVNMGTDKYKELDKRLEELYTTRYGRAQTGPTMPQRT